MMRAKRAAAKSAPATVATAATSLPNSVTATPTIALTLPAASPASSPPRTVAADAPSPAGNYFSSTGVRLGLETDDGRALARTLKAYFNAVSAHGVQPGADLQGWLASCNMLVYEYTCLVKNGLEVQSVKYGRVQSRCNTNVAVVYIEGGNEVLHYGTVQSFYAVDLNNQGGDRIRVKLADVTFYHKLQGSPKDGVHFEKINRTRPYARNSATAHIVDVASIKGKVVFMSATADGKETFAISMVKN
jgi:hypothetical protein